MTTEQSRDYLRLHLAGVLASFPELSTMVEQRALSVAPLIMEGRTANPQDLMRYIIAEKSRSRPTVSTDLDETCGGYSGYIYTIHAPVYPVDWSTAIPGLTIRPAGLWPTLYLNAPTLAAATKIAIKNKHGIQELTFFTPIPREEIAECRLNGTVIYTR